jgi:hypothetical protein
MQYRNTYKGSLKLNEVYVARKEYDNQVVEKFLNKNYYNPEYMYNTEGPEILRLYSAKDNTEHYTFTDVLDAVYNNVVSLPFSGFRLNITTLCSFVRSFMPSNPSGPSTILMKKAPFHQNSEVNML